MTFTASDVLLKAASRIEEEGMWCQRTFFKGPANDYLDTLAFERPTSYRMPECAIGALISSTLELGADEDVCYYAQERLIKTIGDESIGDWNDEPGRTANEVAEAMREAAL